MCLSFIATDMVCWSLDMVMDRSVKDTLKLTSEVNRVFSTMEVLIFKVGSDDSAVCLDSICVKIRSWRYAFFNCDCLRDIRLE